MPAKKKTPATLPARQKARRIRITTETVRRAIKISTLKDFGPGSIDMRRFTAAHVRLAITIAFDAGFKAAHNPRQ